MKLRPATTQFGRNRLTEVSVPVLCNSFDILKPALVKVSPLSSDMSRKLVQIMVRPFSDLKQFGFYMNLRTT